MTDTTVTHYASWADVPRGIYLTQTQLATLDLPRRPGPVAATVEGRNWRDKKDTFDLYRIDQSQPSPATARQLAARHRTPDSHTCTDCRAHPDLPVTVYSDGARLCRACVDIRHLRALQADDTQHRAVVARHAAELLTSPVAVLHCDLAQRGTMPSGAPRTPSAVRVTAVDGDGQNLIDITVRLVGPRSLGIPAGAVPADDAALPLRQALTGRRVVRWPGELTELSTVLRSGGWRDVIPDGYGQLIDLRDMATWWRGDRDPVTGHKRLPQTPGSAVEKLHLLQQIAADAADDTRVAPVPGTCGDCGGHPDSLSTRDGQHRGLCRACLHIAALRIVQNTKRDQTRQAVARARDLLARDDLAVVQVDMVDRGTSASGRRLKPTAARITATTGRGKPTTDITVRLAGPRARDVPYGALAPEAALSALKKVMAERPILVWDDADHTRMHRLLSDIGWPEAAAADTCTTCTTLAEAVEHWRRDIDPRTYTPRTPVPPGRADRLLHLLQQIAAGPEQDAGDKR